MEDIVKDALPSVLPLNKEEDHNEREKEDDKKAHKKDGRLFSMLIYGGDAEKEDKEQRGVVKEGHEEEEKEEEEKEEKRGGIITNFVSNLVSPLSPKAGQVTHEQKHEAAQAENEDSKSVETGGGIISNLVSNLFHQSNGGGEKREGDHKEGEENMNFFGGRKKAKIDKKGEERGGIMDSIVSHLPTSLPDDAAPTTEEASILINSIVKD